MPTRAEWRTALAADLHYDQNDRSGRGTPSHHPGQAARRAGRDEATWRLRGRVARSRFHRSVAVVRVSLGESPQRYRARYAFSSGLSMGKSRKSPSNIYAMTTDWGRCDSNQRRDDGNDKPLDKQPEQRTDRDSDEGRRRALPRRGI